MVFAKALNNVILNGDHIANVTSHDFPYQYSADSENFDIDQLLSNVRVKVESKTIDELQFDMIGVDAALANTFRRIVIAETPTMAIEKIYFMNNTSVIHDEVLAQRLGLVPMLADPTQFDFKTEQEAPTDLNTLVMTLDVKCYKDVNTGQLVNTSVYSKELKWSPKGDQAEKFKDYPIEPYYKDILLAKLSLGQEIKAELHIMKGIGKDHAKFSPVATCTYRLLPHIEILEDIEEQDIDKFVSCFGKDVLKVKEVNGRRKVTVKNQRNYTMSREVLRHDEFKDKVRISRIRDHFMFSIESCCGIVPERIFVQSIDVLRQKCIILKKCLEELRKENLNEIK